MTCSSCPTTQTTTCVKKDSPCKPSYACECEGEKVISIQPIVPVSTCDESQNKYSIEVNIKPRAGKGSQTSKYVDVVTGNTQQELSDNMLTLLVKVVNDIIRSVIGETYLGSDVTFAEATHMVDLATFQAYFRTSVLTGTPAQLDLADATQIAYVDYITQQVFESFLSIRDYILGNASSLVICAGDAGKVYQLKISNCLFCYTIIYN